MGTPGAGDSASFSCDFEDTSTCSFDADGWLVASGSTPTSSTGPSSANDGAYYVYTESSSPNYPAVSTKLTQDLGASYSVTSVSFYYSMYGATMGSLILEASADSCSTWATLWSKSGNQGDSWHEATVETAHQSHYSCIRFVAVTGDSYRSDIGLDDITVVAVLPPTATPTMTPNPTQPPTMTFMPTAPQTDCLTVKATYTGGYHYLYGPFIWTLTSASTSALMGTGQAGDGVTNVVQVCHAVVKPGEC